MHLKYNNTYIVEKMEEVPIKELKMGNQIIMFHQEKDEHFENGFDVQTHLILSQILCGKLYSFECAELFPKYRYNEIEIPEAERKDEYEITREVLESVDFASINQSNIAYLLIDEKMFFLGNSDHYNNFRVYDMKEDSYERNHLVDYPLFSQIHREMFVINNPWTRVGTHHLKEKVKSNPSYYVSHFYLTYPLDNDNVIVMLIEHEFIPENMYWYVKKEVFLLSRDKILVHLSVDNDMWVEIHGILKETDKALYSSNFKDFDEHIFVADYDIKDHIEATYPPYGLHKVTTRMANNSAFWNDKVFEKFYEPIYEYPALKFKSYMKSLRKNEQCCLYTVDGKIIPEYNIKKLENGEEIYKHVRIAGAIRQFLYFSSTGINPKTGEYIPPTPDGSINKTYEDAGGFITKDGTWGESYIFIEGYTVKATSEEHKEICDRKTVMQKLSQGKQLTQEST